VLNPILVVVFVLAIVRWDLILFGIENYDSDDWFFMFRTCSIEVPTKHNSNYDMTLTTWTLRNMMHSMVFIIYLQNSREWMFRNMIRSTVEWCVERYLLIPSKRWDITVARIFVTWCVQRFTFGMINIPGSWILRNRMRSTVTVCVERLNPSHRLRTSDVESITSNAIKNSTLHYKSLKWERCFDISALAYWQHSSKHFQRFLFSTMLARSVGLIKYDIDASARQLVYALNFISAT